MKNAIFTSQNAIFKFDQKEVIKQIIQNRSIYESDEADKLLKLISIGNQETIVLPEEPVFFDSIALDLIAAGHGSALCKTCNKTYVAGQLKPIVVGFDGSPLDIQRERKGLLKHLFMKKRKPPTMYGGKAYECPEGHNLISVIIWKTF